MRLRTTLVKFEQMRTKDNVFVSIDLGMFLLSSFAPIVLYVLHSLRSD
jgi:hypothetical protein